MVETRVTALLRHGPMGMGSCCPSEGAGQWDRQSLPCHLSCAGGFVTRRNTSAW